MPQRLHLLSPGSTEDFSLVPLHCSRGYIFSPLETLRTFYSSSPALARRRGGLYLASTLPQGLHLLAPRDTEDFLLAPLHCPRGYIFSPPETRRTFSLSCLHSHDGEEVFNLPLHCPRGYIFSPPETLRTFSLSRLHSLDGEEVFILPQNARGR